MFTSSLFRRQLYRPDKAGCGGSLGLRGRFGSRSSGSVEPVVTSAHSSGAGEFADDMPWA
jgi:hypothetical protein